MGVLVAAHVVEGITYDGIASLLVAALLLGLLNSFVRPVLTIIALPLVVVTLGLFLIVINGFLLYLVGGLMKTFHVTSFSAALWGGIVIGIVSFIINIFIGKQEGTVVFGNYRGSSRRRIRRDDDDVIDV